jgi:D-alanyl-D-alanine carboxypeptidase
LTVRKLSTLAEELTQLDSVSDLKIRIEDYSGELLFEYIAPGAKETHFIASSTKMMVSAIAFQLAESDQLSLTDSLDKLMDGQGLRLLTQNYPDLELRAITFDMLLRHSSGFRDYRKPGELLRLENIEAATRKHPGWSFEEIVELSAKNGYDHKRSVNYSGLNYQLIEHVLTNVTGVSAAQLIEKHIARPLGLKSTRLFTRENLEDFGNHSQLLVGNRLYLGARRMASLGFEGGITSTTRDTVAFLRGYFSGQLFSEGLRHNSISNSRALYPGVKMGAGVMKINLPARVRALPSLQQTIGHPGMTGHQMFYLPHPKVFVAMTPNQIGDLRLGSKLLVRILMQLNEVL